MDTTIAKSVDIIADDPFLSYFLNDTYRSIYGAEDGNALDMEQVAKLTTAIDALTQDIYAIVSDCYPALLDQAANLEQLQLTMSRFQERVTALIAAVDKLRSRFNDPFNKISRRMVLLLRLKSTTDLLRKVIRVLQLVKRVQQLAIADTATSMSKRDLTKCNQYIADIDALLAGEEQLQAIDAIKPELALIADLKTRLTNMATDDSAAASN